MAGWGMDGMSARIRGIRWSLLPRVASACSCVVQAFALAVHPPVPFRTGFLGAAALIGNFAYPFLFCGVARGDRFAVGGASCLRDFWRGQQ